MDEPASLSDLEGEDWEKWADALGRDGPLDDEESDSDEPKPEPIAECKRLPLEDMTLFGFCPKMDAFSCIVCEVCQALVKPQFFHEHIVLRHSATSKVTHKPKVDREDIKSANNNNNNNNNNNVPVKSRKTVCNSASKEESLLQVEKKCESSKLNYQTLNDKNLSATSRTSQVCSTGHSNSKSSDRRPYPPPPPAVKEVKLTSTSAAAAVVTSSAKPVNSQSSKQLETVHVKTVPNILSQSVKLGSTKCDMNNIGSVVSKIQPIEVEQDISTKKKRKAPPPKEKIYSPDIHCGVWNEQTKKNCMRALTCRTHSLLLKRAVPMRSKLFDVLLADHRAINRAKKDKEETLPSYRKTTAPVEPALVESSLNEILACIAKNRFTSGMTFALHGSMASRLVYSWRIPELTTPVTLLNHRPSYLMNLKPLEPAIPGSSLPGEPTRMPQLKPIFPKPSILKRDFSSAAVSESLFTNAHPKPLSVCSFTPRKDRGSIFPDQHLGRLRRVVKTALDDNFRLGSPIRLDPYGFPVTTSAAVTGTHYSHIKAVLSNICGRAAQRSANARNAKLHGNKSGSHSNKNSGKNVPKKTTLVFKTYPVGSQTTINKDSSQHSKIASVHAFTLVGTNLKAQPKANLKRLAGESFKENDVVKSPRKSNPALNPAEIFGKSSQHSGHVVAVAYSNGGKASSEGNGTSLLRTSDRSEHGPGESLLVSNRSVGLLATRPHSSIGDSMPQVSTGITANNTTASADQPEYFRNKAKGASLIRLAESKSKISGQPVTCLASGQTMMTLQQVLGPQVTKKVITQVQVTPKQNAGSTNLKFIPQAQSVSLSNTKTFLLKKDHGET